MLGAKYTATRAPGAIDPTTSISSITSPSGPSASPVGLLPRMIDRDRRYRRCRHAQAAEIGAEIARAGSRRRARSMRRTGRSRAGRISVQCGHLRRGVETPARRRAGRCFRGRGALENAAAPAGGCRVRESHRPPRPTRPADRSRRTPAIGAPGVRHVMQLDAESRGELRYRARQDHRAARRMLLHHRQAVRLRERADPRDIGGIRAVIARERLRGSAAHALARRRASPPAPASPAGRGAAPAPLTSSRSAGLAGPITRAPGSAARSLPFKRILAMCRPSKLVMRRSLRRRAARLPLSRAANTRRTRR